MGAACEAAGVPQDVWSAWGDVRELPDAQVPARTDGGDPECEQREQGVDRGDAEPGCDGECVGQRWADAERKDRTVSERRCSDVLLRATCSMQRGRVTDRALIGTCLG